MTWANTDDDQPLEHRLITKSLEQAQVRVEGHNFDIRKRVLDYDDVVNKQRAVIYAKRRELLAADRLRESYLELLTDAIEGTYENFVDEDATVDEIDHDALYRQLFTVFPVPQEILPDSLARTPPEELLTMLVAAGRRVYEAKANSLEEQEPGLMAKAERIVMLRAIDQHWQQHLTDLDILREGIGLMAIAQRDPLVEYQREAFSMFRDMQGAANQQALRDIFLVHVNVALPKLRQMRALRPVLSNGAEAARPEPVRVQRKIGRNDPCWCGSGKKYKQCHMRQDRAEGQKARATAG